MPEKDPILVGKTLGGDAQAFGDLVERYGPLVRGLLIETVRRPADRTILLIVFIFFFVLCFPLSGWTSADAQHHPGYQVTGDRITVDSAVHWRHWQLPVHAVDITPEGWVQPHFFREQYNILDDRNTFVRVLPDFKPQKGKTAILNLDSTETLDVRGEVVRDRKGNPLYTYFLRPGISRVGSNPESAANILDGDPRTYWEPDREDFLENGWIEVDLGRVVAVDAIVLHFVDPDLGDPFRQFRIRAAPNQDPNAQDIGRLAFKTVGGTAYPNHDQRDFRFPLGQDRADPAWTGHLIETIRIVMTDTKGGRSRPVAEAEWSALTPEERGDVVYFARDQEGGEAPVDASLYADLPVERRGHREYYVRERPRLADIEVWGWGDNLSLGACLLAGEAWR